MRPWKKVIDPSADHLVLEGNDGDRSELQVISCPCQGSNLEQTSLPLSLVTMT